MMRRSGIVVVVLGLSLAHAVAFAQEPAKLPVVAVLITHAATNDPFLDGLRAGLREHGLGDGGNFRLEPVTAAGKLDRLPAIAEELVRRKVDVIVVPNELGVRTAQKATSTIPIVMMGMVGDDPVALGLIRSFRRPGGNTTGIYNLLSESEAKRLEILKEALPKVTRVAVFWDQYNRKSLEEVQRAAKSLGVQVEPIQLRGPQDVDSAFQAAKRAKVGAVMPLWSPTTYTHREQIAALAIDGRLPSIWPFIPAVKAGALISYGTDVREIYRRTGYYVSRLLKGAKPGDLPVEQISKFQLGVNLKTAKALGVKLPQSILVRAEEVIQ